MTSIPAPTPGLVRFNTLSDSAFLALLYEVCASKAWGRKLLAHRPYATEDALFAAADTAMGELTDTDLAEAMGGHPPIGRPEPGDPVSSREQRGMAGASEALRAEMRELNLAYQERFGHVFLICATGATGEQMRDALRERLAHTPEQERAIARTELGKINRIRLAGLVTASAASVSTHILDTSTGRPAADVAVSLAARTGPDAAWQALGGSRTDADGRCKDLPALPEGTVQVRLEFATEAYFVNGISRTSRKQAEEQRQETSSARGNGAFFPEVTVTFTVTAGEHYHVPLLLNPFGYSVYRGS